MKKLLLLLLCVPLVGFSQKNENLHKPDSVKARFILLTNYNFSVDSAFTTLNVIRNKVIRGADFGQLATQFSEDKGSAIKGGDLGWFTEGVMVPEFQEACFNSEIGDLIIVYTRFGTCLIQIMDNR